MKKKYLLISFLFIVGMISCSSDDSSPDKDVIKPTTKEWIPSKISLGTLFTEDYPHVAGCEQDFIRIISNNSAIFFEHEPQTCNITETEPNWTRNGNQVSLTYLNTQISGTVKQETEVLFVIEANAAQFTEIIILLYPELVPLTPLFGTMNIEITMVKR